MVLRCGLTKNDTGKKIFRLFITFAFWAKKERLSKADSNPRPPTCQADHTTTILLGPCEDEELFVFQHYENSEIQFSIAVFFSTVQIFMKYVCVLYLR